MASLANVKTETSVFIDIFIDIYDINIIINIQPYFAEYFVEGCFGGSLGGFLIFFWGGGAWCLFVCLKHGDVHLRISSDKKFFISQ